MSDEKKEIVVDEDAPKVLKIKMVDGEDVWLDDVAAHKVFSTGSVGYYLSGKMTNPKSGKRYQVSCNITLIGSKPEKAE